jgi:hypothetical protein
MTREVERVPEFHSWASEWQQTPIPKT